MRLTQQELDNLLESANTALKYSRKLKLAFRIPGDIAVRLVEDAIEAYELEEENIELKKEVVELKEEIELLRSKPVKPNKKIGIDVDKK